MGSAVDKDNLNYLIPEYGSAGIGGLEITPIYGVQGNDANDIPFLSKRWMEMLDHCNKVGAKAGVKIDMNTGTGWPSAALLSQRRTQHARLPSTRTANSSSGAPVEGETRCPGRRRLGHGPF